MADLQKLYEQYGLPGIVPYSFQRKGHQFMVEKLQEASPIYLLFSSELNSPFLTITKEGATALLYSEESRAETAQSNLKQEGYKTYIKTFAEDIQRQNLWDSLRDIGVKILLLDDMIHVKIFSLTQKVPYDGFVGLEKPLRNLELNAALHVYYQDIKANYIRPKLHCYLLSLLQNGHLLLPMIVASKPGQSLTNQDVIFPYFKNQSGKDCILAFTDWNFYHEYMNNNMPDEQETVFISDYHTLKNFLDANQTTILTLNPTSINVDITADYLRQFERQALDYNASEALEKNMEDDSMPDFLRSGNIL